MSPFVDSLRFPGVPPRLNLAHRAFAGGKGRLAAVAMGDGTMRDLLSGVVNNPATNMQGGLTPGMGPTVNPKPSSAPMTGCPFNAVIPSEVMTAWGVAAIFSPRSSGIGQGMVNPSGSSGSSYKFQVAAFDAQFDLANVKILDFGTTIASHVYFVAACTTSGAVAAPQSKSQGVMIDLTTGQLVVATHSTGASVTTGSVYSVGTYVSTGGADPGLVACGAIFARWLPMPDLIDWAVNDPWGLWYEREAQPLMFMSGSITGSPPGSNSMSLITNDAVETFAATATNVAPPTPTVDTHDGGAPEELLDLWRKAAELENPKEPESKPEKRTVFIRRLKAKPKVMVRRKRSPQ